MGCWRSSIGQMLGILGVGWCFFSGLVGVIYEVVGTISGISVGGGMFGGVMHCRVVGGF